MLFREDQAAGFDSLTPEQFAGARFLASRRVAMLADRVGFGKSAQFVRAAELCGARSVTVLCPPALCMNEAAEFRKWELFGWPIVVLKKGADDVPSDGVVVASYALAGREDVKKKLRKRRADILILDESHNVKNSRGARTKAIFKKDGIAATAGRTWFVSGTPTPNHAGEWYVFARACGAWTGGYIDFVTRYCVTVDGHFGLKIIGSNPDTRAELLALLGPHVLARDKVDEGRSPLTIDTVSVYGKEPDFSNVDATTLELIRAAVAAGDWALLDGPSVSTVRRQVGIAKAAGSAALIAEEMAETKFKSLIFCEHTAVIDAVTATLTAAGVPCGVIDGRTSAKKREEIISAFEPNGSDAPYRAAIIQRMSLKEGRTMTRAERVHIIEPPWTPDDITQMIARSWRRGQRSPVRASIHHLAGSLDEAIARTLARKARDVAEISIRS